MPNEVVDKLVRQNTAEINKKFKEIQDRIDSIDEEIKEKLERGDSNTLDLVSSRQALQKLIDRLRYGGLESE